MRVRYVGPVEELTVVPAGQQEFTVKRLEWVEVDASLVGRRPKNKPHGDAFDPGTGLLAQGEWDDDGFKPYWESEPAKKAQQTRAANEEA